MLTLNRRSAWIILDCGDYISPIRSDARSCSHCDATRVEPNRWRDGPPARVIVGVQTGWFTPWWRGFRRSRRQGRVQRYPSRRYHRLFGRTERTFDLGTEAPHRCRFHHIHRIAVHWSRTFSPSDRFSVTDGPTAGWWWGPEREPNDD